MKKVAKNKRYLFAIDLDGTLLSSSVENTIHPLTIEGIEKAINEGHIVCLITGRPWIGSKFVYEKLKLNTIIANLNGAHIHNPTDEFFIDYIKYINLNEMLYILGDPNLKNKIKNLAIEGPGWVHLQHRDEEMERIFNFHQFPKLKIGINLDKIPLKPTGIVMDIKKNVDAKKLKKYLNQKYSDLASFSYWSKGKDKSYIFDVAAIGVDKGKVISLLMRYYDIDLKNTVAIGDSFNDEEMLDNVNYSVAMKNADDHIKEKAKYVTNLTNKEGGVGEFIINFLEGKLKK
ncbi:MAG: HAD family phosphatase [Mycoplasma sp.]|nr:HAD family phosphatase [Mycoplasma sp.]